MERADARAPLHSRLMLELDRGARAQQHSQQLVAAHALLDAQLRATLAEVRARRHELRSARQRARTFAIGQFDDRGHRASG
jgi:hypothetical protein